MRARSFWLLCLVPLCWADCPTDTVCETGLDRCYKFVPYEVDFLSAEDTCVALGGHLVSIRNDFEEALVQETAKSMFEGQSNYWIGANRILTGNWSWNDGSSWKYANWGLGGERTERVVHVSQENGYWSTAAETETKPFVCAFPYNFHNSHQCPECPSTTAAAQITCPTTVAPTPCPRRAFCEDGWVHFEESKSCYQVIHNLNFASAEQKCVEKGGHLASIHSKPENDFVAEISKAGLEIKSNPGGATWIGLQNVANVYRWTDGTPVTFLNWAEEEPNNYGGTELCTQLYSDKTDTLPPYLGRWNDVVCTVEMRAAVCKKPEL